MAIEKHFVVTSWAGEVYHLGDKTGTICRPNGFSSSKLFFVDEYKIKKATVEMFCTRCTDKKFAQEIIAKGKVE